MLYKFLKGHKLENYYQRLSDLGYDDLNFLKTRSLEQLKNICAAVKMKPGHSDKFIYYLLNKPNNFTINQPTNSDTYIGVVFDISGSMQNIIHDAIGGYNSFMEEQKKNGVIFYKKK